MSHPTNLIFIQSGRNKKRFMNLTEARLLGYLRKLMAKDLSCFLGGKKVFCRLA